MSELSSSVKHPLTPHRLVLLIPRGWDTHSEPESDNALSTIEIEADKTVPPHDIMDFLADVETLGADTEPAPPTRFAVPLSDDAVKETRKAAVPKTTQKDTLWCIRLWNEWRKERNSRTEEQIPADIIALSPAVLQPWLSRFVLEVTKKDATAYPPDSLYHVMWYHEIYAPKWKT